jgi:lysophospholipase L1-like esterase
MRNGLILATLLTACGHTPATSPSLPTVLVIGDSISIGYTPHVARALKDTATVVHNEGNAQWSANTLANLDAYLAQAPSADVITWNNGLHDMRIVAETGEVRATVDEYAANLEAIGLRLLDTGATVIFFTTTHVPEGAPNRDPADVEIYNAMARDVMSRLGIQVYELGAFSETITDTHTSPTNIHFTDEGSGRLAEFVTDAILDQLDE